MSDFRAAVRALRKSPASRSSPSLTIAVGIGANTALFSVYDRLVLQPGDDSGPVVARRDLDEQPAAQFQRAGGVVAAVRGDSRAGARRSASIGISAFDNFTLTGNGEPEQLNGQRVSADVLSDARHPARRAAATSRPDEDLPNGPAVCIISHELWQTRFGGRAVARRRDDHAQRPAVAGRRHHAAAADARRSARCRCSRRACSRSAA